MDRHGARQAVVRNWDEVPAFGTEAEEAAFWATHDLSDELLARMAPDADPRLPPPRPRTRPIAIRLDESTLGRLKALAARRGKGYQTLLKEFVVERLYEEELRDEVIESPRGAPARRRPAGPRRDGKGSV